MPSPSSSPSPSPSPSLPAPSLPGRLRHHLVEAMKAGDRPAVAALRQTLAAIANAEAPPLPALRVVPTPGAEPAAPLGEPNAGGAEHPRLELSEADVERILRAEITEREVAAAEYLRIDRPAEAAAVEAEAAVLRTYLP